MARNRNPLRGKEVCRRKKGEGAGNLESLRMEDENMK